MPTLNLKSTHKPVKAYHAALDQFAKLDVTPRDSGAGGFSGAAGALRAAVSVDAGAGVWGEYGEGQADCGGRGAGGRLPPDARVLGGQRHPRRLAGGGGGQVCGGLPARQYPVSDAAADEVVVERRLGVGFGS